MKRRYALLAPGEFAARRVDRNYVKSTHNAERKVKRGDNKLLWTTQILSYVEYVTVMIFGLLMGSWNAGFVWLLVIVVFVYPFAALADLWWIWPKIYGRLAWGISYKVPFLTNLKYALLVRNRIRDWVVVLNIFLAFAPLIRSIFGPSVGLSRLLRLSAYRG